MRCIVCILAVVFVLMQPVRQFAQPHPVFLEATQRLQEINRTERLNQGDYLDYNKKVLPLIRILQKSFHTQAGETLDIRRPTRDDLPDFYTSSLSDTKTPKQVAVAAKGPTFQQVSQRRNPRKKPGISFASMAERQLQYVSESSAYAKSRLRKGSFQARVRHRRHRFGQRLSSRTKVYALGKRGSDSKVL